MPVPADTVLSMSVAEDAGVPSGAVGSLVNAFTGGITDVDSGVVKGIAITATDQTNGTWYQAAATTARTGRRWERPDHLLCCWPTTPARAVLCARGQLHWVVVFGSHAARLGSDQWRRWHQGQSTSTNGGTSAFSSATDVIDVTVTPVNNAPVLHDWYNAAWSHRRSIVLDSAQGPDDLVGFFRY
ncbi:MAG: hypothetical protein R3E68_02500 [Burkholderiaceae bacterium]